MPDTDGCPAPDAYWKNKLAHEQLENAISDRVPKTNFKWTNISSILGTVIVLLVIFLGGLSAQNENRERNSVQDEQIKQLQETVTEIKEQNKEFLEAQHKRDVENAKIQAESAKIQEQIFAELKKLNGGEEQ